MIEIASGALTAAIDPFGAELQSLKDRGGREYMWSGDPAFWTGRAPLLFPIIGRLEGDLLRSGGQTYHLEKHGFARRSRFEAVDSTTQSVRFRLTDSEATRAAYPFAFVLEIAFALAGATLAMTATIINPGDGPLPFSFGYHPAFSWPLPGGGAREAHRIVFDRPEPASLARVTPDGTIANAPKASPVKIDAFTLANALFEDDALVWTDLASRALRYEGPEGATLDIAFPDTPYLGIWTKPGAHFVCIEPWAGHADPAGYDGNFAAKPGVMTLEPGGSRRFRMDVTVRT